MVLKFIHAPFKRGDVFAVGLCRIVSGLEYVRYGMVWYGKVWHGTVR